MPKKIGKPSMTNRSSFELENIGSLYENGKKF